MSSNKIGLILIIFILILVLSTGCSTTNSTTTNTNSLTPTPEVKNTPNNPNIIYVTPYPTQISSQSRFSSDDQKLVDLIKNPGKGSHNSFSPIMNDLNWDEYKTAYEEASAVSIYYQIRRDMVTKIPVSNEFVQVKTKYLQVLDHYVTAANYLQSVANYGNMEKWSSYNFYLDKAQTELNSANSKMNEITIIIRQLESTAQSTSQNACTFTGTWNWMDGMSIVEIRNDGKVIEKHNNGLIHYATWTSLPNDNITIKWEEGGWVDTVKLSDCNHLEGYNNEKARITGWRMS